VVDIAVGDRAPVVTHTLTRTDLVRYAGASGDYNPMHHDEVKATAAGMPSVFGHGMLSMGILGTAVTGWLGAGAVRRFGVRFVKQTWPGDTLATDVLVTDVREEDGELLAELECHLRNQDEQPVVSGSATVVLAGGGR
jgi:acyl dehydratase